VGGGAGGGQVRYLHTVLGIGKWSIIPFENIKSVDMLVGMQSRGRRGTPYYDVLATLLNGRHRTFLSSIRDKRHAEWILAEIRTAIGLRSQ